MQDGKDMVDVLLVDYAIVSQVGVGHGVMVGIDLVQNVANTVIQQYQAVLGVKVEMVDQVEDMIINLVL